MNCDDVLVIVDGMKSLNKEVLAPLCEPNSNIMIVDADSIHKPQIAIEKLAAMGLLKERELSPMIIFAEKEEEPYIPIKLNTDLMDYSSKKQPPTPITEDQRKYLRSGTSQKRLERKARLAARKQEK